MPGIALKDLHFSYAADAPVLRGVSLEVAPRQIVALLGRNGAGKTTTFRIATGLLAPGGGAALIEDIDLAVNRQGALKRLAFVPEDSLLYQSLSAEENLNMFGLLWGVAASTIRERAPALLDELGLWPVRRQRVSALSNGMRQRLSTGVALIHDPAVLFLDEPFSGLDVDSAAAMRRLLRRRANAGAAILFSSHAPELVEALADEIAILDDGRITARGSCVQINKEGGAVRFLLAHSQRQRWQAPA